MITQNLLTTLAKDLQIILADPYIKLYVQVDKLHSLIIDQVTYEKQDWYLSTIDGIKFRLREVYSRIYIIDILFNRCFLYKECTRESLYEEIANYKYSLDKLVIQTLKPYAGGFLYYVADDHGVYRQVMSQIIGVLEDSKVLVREPDFTDSRYQYLELEFDPQIMRCYSTILYYKFHNPL